MCGMRTIIESDLTQVGAIRKTDEGERCVEQSDDTIHGPYRFEHHNGYGSLDPDGNPWPFGYISSTIAGGVPMPIFELNTAGLVYLIEHLVATARILAASSDMLAALINIRAFVEAERVVRLNSLSINGDASTINDDDGATYAEAIDALAVIDAAIHKAMTGEGN